MKYVVGIDEVGRGPLAGPVVLAAAAIPVSFRPRLRSSFAKAMGGRSKGYGGRSPKRYIPLRDSKKLTAIQRERWSEYLLGHPKVILAVTRAYPKTIDDVNIAQAANKAARKALRKILKNISPDDLAGVYLDGGLYLQKLRHSRGRADVHTETVKLGRNVSLAAHTVVKGDEKIASIKIASVIAKVHRDNFMVKEAKKYPGYGFERHKGYSTKSHREAIRKLGLSKIHRLTFTSESVTMIS